MPIKQTSALTVHGLEQVSTECYIPPSFQPDSSVNLSQRNWTTQPLSKCVLPTLILPKECVKVFIDPWVLGREDNPGEETQALPGWPSYNQKVGILLAALRFAASQKP